MPAAARSLHPLVSKLGIIVSTTRPTRIGPKVAAWVAEQADDAGWDVEVLDVSHLPFLDEEQMPSQGNYAKPHTLDWATTVAGLDAVVIVTAQYNRGVPAPIKNAIDYLYAEWQGKPIALVGYGWGGAGDARSDLTRVLTHVKAEVVGSTGLSFRSDLEVDGAMTVTEPQQAAVAKLLGDLAAAAEGAELVAS